jgi:hypothetical protein
MHPCLLLKSETGMAPVNCMQDSAIMKDFGLDVLLVK